MDYTHMPVYLFLVHCPALLQILAGVLLFSQGYHRRNAFWGRFLGGTTAAMIGYVPVCCLLTALPSYAAVSILQTLFVYIYFLLIGFLVLRFCFFDTRRCLLTGLLTGYAYQHLAGQACLIVYTLYKHFCGHAMDARLYRTIELLFYVLLAVAVYLLFARTGRTSAESPLQDRNILLLFFCTIGLLLVLSSFRDYYQEQSLALTLVTRVFSIFCCILLFLLRGGFFEESRLEAEMQTIEQLHRKEKAQYEMNRETIDLINAKCHDIRHRLAQYRHHPDAITREELLQLEKGINIYDRTIKTGNETLDTILTERSLLCEHLGITFSCIIDGASLDFLSPGDIYSLFGNAVDNAIDAVNQLDTPDDRVISLTVRRRIGMLSILIDNRYAGTITFADGLPKTTKDDTSEHGFGMRSIRMIVQKYGGEMSVAADELFHLSILLPIPQQT